MAAPIPVKLADPARGEKACPHLSAILWAAPPLAGQPPIPMLLTAACIGPICTHWSERAEGCALNVLPPQEEAFQP